jgi:hypothetical protein
MSTWTRGTLPTEHRHSQPGVYLYWIPLGAGGSGFVRMNGRIYEMGKALMQRRRPLHLCHTALAVRLPEGDFIVETMWPSPDNDTGSRGVVVEGPVFAPWLAPTRLFRYEVRRWSEGVLPDADQAIDGPQRVSGDLVLARELLDRVASVPSLIWGRDQLGMGDMWNSNSVISWLLAMSGVPMDSVRPPKGARAPGWKAGIEMARRLAVGATAQT